MKKLTLLTLVTLLLTSVCFADEVKVQVRFTAETQYGSFADALYFTEAEWAANPDVEAMKQQLIDNYVALMDEMTSQNEPTKEELKKQKVSLDERIETIQSIKQELEAKIAEMP